MDTLLLIPGFWQALGEFGSNYESTLVFALLLVVLVMLIAGLVILRALRIMLRILAPNLEREEKEARLLVVKAKRDARKRRWNKLLGLRPISEEKDIVIDHEYDGIQELDNPIPAWFNGMFYASVAFGVVYLCIYHVFGWGLNQDQEYEREVARAEQARQEWLAQAANNVDESNVEVNLSPEVVGAGKAIFTMSCAVCHGEHAEGGIGPNLTDEYWLHGGEIKDIFKVVKYGVLDKGMTPWEQSLTPAQIAEVSNYIISIRGTKPANAKDPQGAKVEYATGKADEMDSEANILEEGQTATE